MGKKICSQCGEKKDINLFSKKSKSDDGHTAECRECHNKMCRRSYFKNLEENRKKSRQQYYKHRDEPKYIIKRKEHRESHRDERKEYNKIFRKRRRDLTNATARRYIKKHPEKKREWDRQYRENHKEQINKRKREWWKENNKIANARSRRYKSHLDVRIKHNLRSRIYAALSGRTKGGHMMELVGCDLTFFKSHLKSLWQEGMSWDNYGHGLWKWSIDHNPPLAMYDMEDVEQQKIAFHWTHSFPMWNSENCAKGSLFEGKRYFKKRS